VFGSQDQDADVFKLDVVTQVYAVIRHGSFVQMIQPGVPVVLLHSGLSNVDLTHIQEMLQAQGISKPRSSSMGEGNWQPS
jgi:hypothetical protein